MVELVKKPAATTTVVGQLATSHTLTDGVQGQTVTPTMPTTSVGWS